VSAKSDYERYGALVAEDGIIAFHDIWEFPSEERYLKYGNETPMFWKELSSRVSSREIIDNSFPPAQWDGYEVRSRFWPPAGIGVVLGNRGAKRPEGS
jgi:hypothetical protein